MEEIKDIKNGRYSLKGNLSFDIEGGTLNVKASDALEIAYTLFDWAGKSYDVLDEIYDEILKREGLI